MKLKQLVVAVSLSLGLAACGGGGGSSSSSSSPSYDFKVTAVDGYLKNAVVTATCDGKTFTGTTNENGVAELNTNSTNCSVVITAKADGSTMDMDTGETYAAGSLYLVSPAGQNKTSLIASPFTTMVALLMQSSNGSVDLETAIAQIADDFGIDASVVTGDFIAAGNDEAALKASALLSSAVLPKTAEEFNAQVANESTTQAVITKLLKINTAVEAQIEELKNNGEDLSTVIITVTVAADGSVTTAVEDKPLVTGATDSAVGGGTGN